MDYMKIVSGKPSRQIVFVPVPVFFGTVMWPEKLIIIDLN